MARQPMHLVSQFLEGISRKALEKFQGIIRQFVHRRHGIYALHRKGRLYYVGLASNLRARLTHHLEDRHSSAWDTFSVYLTINEKHMRQLEALVLRISSPKGNIKKGGLGKAENMRKQFWNAISDSQRQELESLFSGKRRHETIKRVRIRKGKAITLAPFVTKGFKIRMSYQGKWHWASVHSNGVIVLRSKKFTSPSRAASIVVGGRPINGWDKWLYQRAPGDWVTLDKLRV